MSAKDTVKQWFEQARSQGRYGRVYINLWYAPNAKAFQQLSKPLIYRGVDTGLVQYEDGLYKQSAGSGDCEELLVFIGQMTKE